MANGIQPTGGQGSVSPQMAASSLVDAHVVDCATELFLDEGIAAVKMTEIAEAAGVGVATLYRHFSTKASIAAASATVLWQHLAHFYDDLVASEQYLRLNGADRLKMLLETYCTRHLYRPGFASLVDELDRLIMEGSVGEEGVCAYAQSVEMPYAHFEQAYLLGRRDGSIGRETDFALFYRSVAHALLSVAGKLSRGEVLPSDDFSGGASKDELGCLVDIAVRSLDVRS